MRARNSLLLFAPVLFLFQNLSAQPVISAQLQGTQRRIPLEVQAGKNRIELCGLTPGNTYNVIAVGMVAGQKIDFKLSMVSNRLEKQAAQQSRSDRPQYRRFKAPAGCVDLTLQVQAAQSSGSLPIYLSVQCADCPTDNTFLDKFIDKAEANLSTIPGVGASSLITNTLIGGNCFDISNITSSGAANSRGTFTSGITNIGLASGMVLSSGNVNALPGPNNAGNTSANTAGFNVNSADDTNLASLTGGNQYDVTKIEFDFTPTANTVQFNYVFGSEEYCEYVGSNFNDVFGFFISGAGITGTQNLALIPSTTTPVAINNVNHITNSAYYINNNTWNPCQAVGAFNIAECALDGWTTMFTATAQVVPCSTYHIKLALADIADAAFMSAVFLQANSFEAGGVVKGFPVYPGSLTYAVEGCGDGFIKFVRGSGDINVPLDINFTLSSNSTATPGADYDPITSPITIPPGQTEILIPINVFADLIIEGQESIILTLDNPCSCTQQSITFLIEDKPPLEIEMEDHTLCGNGGITLAPDIISAGQAPLTYNWSNNAATPSINVTATGTNTYTVTVTDACGTTATASATTTIVPTPTATLSGNGFFCAGSTTGSVNLTINLTGVGPWEVEINENGSTVTQTFTSSPVTYTVTDPGTYSLVGVSAPGGCTGTVSGNVTLTEITVNLNTTPTDPPCFGGNGSILASASGGTGGFTYAWNTSASGANLTGIGPGTYTVTATNGQGCTAEATETITEPPQLTASASNTGNIDCNNPTGSADLDVGGGTPGYSFNWTGGSAQQNPNFTTGGTYTVTVTDSHNCTVTASVTITANTTLPTAVIAPPQQITCTNTGLTLDATGSSQGSQYTYEWGGPGFVCCETTLLPQIDQGGTYTLTVTNSDNGCTKVVSVTVAENNTPPNVNINPPQNIGCTTPTLTLNGNGTSTGAGITFVWSTAGGNFTCCTNTLQPQVNQAGTYTLTVVNSNNGCTNEASVTVTGNTDPPLADIAPPATVDCYSPEIELDGSGSSQGGNFTYNWSASGGGSITGGGNTLNPTVNQGGTYTLTVTNSDNNCTATASVTVAANLTLPVAVATANGTLTCQNPTLTLNGNGSSSGPNFSYEWTTGNGNIVSGETTLNPEINQGGSYTLVVTNSANGCTSSATVNVNENLNLPLANAGPPMELNCLHPAVQLGGSGSSGAGYTLQWTASPGFIVSGAGTFSPTVNQAGTYTLVVTNTANGCTSEDVVEVTSNFDTPTAVIAPPGTIDCYSPQIDLDAGGSTQGGNITFNWTTSNGNITGGNGTPTPTVGQAGTYNLVVTNTDSGCTATASVTVTSNLTPPVAVAAASGTLTCQNPTLVINGNGSSTGSNFSYEWTTANGEIVSGENTLNPVVGLGGTYTLLVTNLTNGCTSTASVNVNSNQNYPLADAGPDLLLNCLHPSLQLSGSGTTGTGITIQWTANPGFIVTGANTYTPTINQAGTYFLVVTNTANGCSTEAVVSVDANFDVPVAVIAPPGTIDCYTPQIDLDAGASSQGGNIQYTWTTANGNIVSGSASPYPTVSQGGSYTLVVTDTDSGCKATATVTVVQDLVLPLANAGPGATLNCNVAQLTLNGTGSTGSNFTYEWNTFSGNIVSGENTLNPVIDAAGTYSLVVTNLTNGCTKQSSVTIFADQNAPSAYAGEDAQLTCASMNVQLSGSGSSTGGNISYQWVASPGNIVSGGGTLSPVVNAYGYYTLIVTNNSNGCTDEDEVFVDDNVIYPTANILPPQQLNCTFSTVQLDAGGSTTGGNIDFVWTTATGNIISGNGTPFPEVDEVGTYNLVVVNTDNSCTATASVTVTQDFTPPVAVAVPTASITCQAPQTTLSGQGSSSGYPFFYEWTTTNGNIVSGQLTLNPTVNQPGAYQLTVFNVENGCTSQASVQVVTSQTFPTASAGAPQEITCAAQQLTLDGSGSSQGTQYNYVWSTQNGNIVSGTNTLNPVVDAPGTYELAVINTQTGCTSAASVLVGQNTTNPLAIVAPGGVLSCTTTTLALSGAGSSGGAGMNYNWSTVSGNIVAGQGTLDPVVSATGVYTLLVTNLANGCTASASTTVTADASLPQASAGPPSTLTCLVTQITLNGSASSQGPAFTYGWTGPGVISGGGTLTPTINEPGPYELLITNTSNGCTAISTVNIPEDVVYPAVDAGPAAVLNCTNTTLALAGSQSVSGIVCNYIWTATGGGNIVSGANTLAPLVDQPGGYILQGINTANGCLATDTVLITKNTVLPAANAGSPGLITCTNATVTLSGSGSTGPQFTYIWSTLNGSIASGQGTLTPVVDAPGTYNLLVTDTINGCTATASVPVAKDANVPTAVAQQPHELTCSIQQMLLNGTGSTTGAGIQYQWTTPNGNIISGANSLTPLVNAPGQYTLNVFNSANNCEAQFTVNLNQNLTPPVANAGVPAVLSCANPVLTLNGSGSSLGSQFSYLWSTVNGYILSGDTTLTPQVDHSGNYTLVVTNTQNGCTAASGVQILLDQNSPQAEAGPGQSITCVAGDVTLNGAGSSIGANFTYQWTALNGGNIVSGGAGLSPVVDAPGLYTLLVTNPSNGCTSVDSVQVILDKVSPVAVIAPPAVLNCQVSQTAISTSGSSTGAQFTYKWTTSGGNIVSGGGSPSPQVNKPGTYNLVITDTGNGCTSTAVTTVVQDVVLPVVDAGPTAELNCAFNNLTLAGTAGSVGNNVQYVWSTSNGNIVSGFNTLAPSIDAPGVYVLTVTNLDNFCTASDQVAISQNVAVPAAVAATAPVLTCANPTANLNANGSSSGPLYAYLWVAQGGGNILSGANTLVPTVNAPGVYVLTVSNTNNKCTATATVTVNQDIVAPAAVAGNTVTLTCTVPSLQLNGAGSSTGSQYAYAWSTLDGQILSGINTLTPVVGAPGLYTLVVSNLNNGCTKDAAVQVLQDADAPVAAAAAPGELTCNQTSLVLSGAGSSVGNTIKYQWTTQGGQILSGATGLSPSVAAPGVYTLLVTNSQNGCTESESVTVTQNTTPPTADAGASGAITCAVTSLSLSGFGTGGGQGVGYSWSTAGGSIVSGSNTATPVIDAGGLYYLTVYDLYNGCTATDQVSVPTDVQAPAIAIADPGLLTCVVFQVTIDAAASDQGPAFSYAWNGTGIVSGAGTLTPLVSQAGPYSLTITNSVNGCTSTAVVTVVQDMQPPLADAGTGFELTCSIADGTLSAAGSSSGSDFAYQWSTPDGNILSASNSIAPLVNAPGTYSLLVTNTQTGCTATDAVLVTENTNYPTALELATDPPGCGGKLGTVKITAVTGGMGPYLYSIDGGSTFLTVDEFANLSPGQYQIVIQDINGCEFSQTLTFPVPVEPEVALPPEISLAFGETATLTAQLNIPIYQVDTIIWAPMESLTLTNKPNVVQARPFTTTQYTVTIINLEGCEDRASIIVRVDDPNLWAPNAISPNRENGKNDVFLIFSGPNTVKQINSVQIYDRWGNMVFHKENIPPNDEKHGWNGRFHGQPMNPAVFVWWAEVELVSGQKIIMKGDVTIVD